MGEGIDLERKAVLHEQQLRRAVEKLKQAARSTIKVGPMVAERPWQWLAGAFTVGLWLGLRQH